MSNAKQPCVKTGLWLNPAKDGRAKTLKTAKFDQDQTTGFRHKFCLLPKHPPTLALFLALCANLSCFPLNFIIQGGLGHLDLITRAEPIDKILDAQRAPPKLAQVLRAVPDIKAFGQKQGLLATESYTHYVELDRPAVVWAVNACKPLAFEPKVWSFPLVGSFPYLGFFNEQDAQESAQKLEASRSYTSCK